MTLLIIDKEKCKRDGICKDVCPTEIIVLEEGFPAMIRGCEEVCIRCGHCVAVCPNTALNHASIPEEEFLPVRPEILPTAEMAEHFLRARRSIRVYRNENVERDLLARLIHIARSAPSGHNSQPVEWRIVYDSREVTRLAGMVIDWMRMLIRDQSPLVETMHLDRVVRSWENGTDRILRRAPHLVIAHADRNERNAPSACTIALTYLELMAPALDLGACWAGYFTRAALEWPPLMKALDLPPSHQVFGAMMVGYPRYRYHRLPPREEPSITWG